MATVLLFTDDIGEQRLEALGFLFVPLVGGGAAVGGVVDAVTHKTIFQAPGSARVAVSPMLAKDQLGAPQRARVQREHENTLLYLGTDY